MRNPRIFTDQPLSEHHVVNLDAAAVRHVSQVLRLKQGQTVTLFNGEGGEFDACLQDVGRGKVSVETSKFRNVNCESPLKIDLGHGLVKGERMDFVVQKAVELGATTITPLIAERSMVKLSPERIGKRLSHWRGIAVHACEQCGRNRIPEIRAPAHLSDWFRSGAAGLRLLLSPNASERLSDVSFSGSEVALLIGPEGGFSEAEESLAKSHEFRPIRFGSRILRTETACIAALSVIQLKWGDLDVS